MAEVNLYEKWYYTAQELVDTLPEDMKLNPNNLQMKRERQILGGMIYALSVTVWGRSRKTVRYPKTWIDALKLRWFPKWALTKWPPVIVKVRYDEVIPMLSTKQNKSSIIQIRSEVTPDMDFLMPEERE